MPERQSKIDTLLKEPEIYCICRTSDSTRFMMYVKWQHAIIIVSCKVRYKSIIVIFFYTEHVTVVKNGIMETVSVSRSLRRTILITTIVSGVLRRILVWKLNIKRSRARRGTLKINITKVLRIKKRIKWEGLKRRRDMLRRRWRKRLRRKLRRKWTSLRDVATVLDVWIKGIVGSVRIVKRIGERIVRKVRGKLVWKGFALSRWDDNRTFYSFFKLNLYLWIFLYRWWCIYFLNFKGRRKIYGSEIS